MEIQLAEKATPIKNNLSAIRFRLYIETVFLDSFEFRTKLIFLFPRKNKKPAWRLAAQKREHPGPVM